MSSSNVYGGHYKYKTGNIVYDIEETNSQYIVIARVQDNALDSHNQNILLRRLRLTAIDLMGACCLYKEYADKNCLTADYFQVYADGINLHYNATLGNLMQERVLKDGNVCLKYVCNKSEYDIHCVTYQSNIDLHLLLISNYKKYRDECSAQLLYTYPKSTLNDYINIERDFFDGNVQLPIAMRKLQVSCSTLEESLYGTDNEEQVLVMSNIVSSLPKSHPYKALCYLMLVSAARLRDKAKFYTSWCQEIESVENIWTDMLLFCANKCSGSRPLEMSISEAIAAFPCAIAPNAVRLATYEPNYAIATQHYANRRFDEAITILTESIDINGVTPRSLNLLGASYRLIGNPKQAMPYLVLSFRLEPKTPYLVGNIILCLEQLGYSKLHQAINLFEQYVIDSWSQEQLELLNKKNIL